MRHKPRLIVLASTYPRWAGDPEPSFVHALCAGLSDQMEVHVICPHANGVKTYEILDQVHIHRFRYAPARFESLVQSGGILSNLRLYPWKWLLLPLFMGGQTIQLWRLVRALEPDGLHAHWIVPQGLIAMLVRSLQRKPSPLLVTSHGGDLYALHGALFEFLKRRVLQASSALTVVSAAMLPEAKRLGATAERIQVIPMGIDFEHTFSPDPEVGRNPSAMLFVGRLVEKKGVHLLLEAMPLIIAQMPQATLKIVGFGPQEQLLRQMVDRLGLSTSVEFLGAKPQQDLPDLYRRAGVFVAPFVTAESGDREGLGLVTLEAIGCGCPVVVGDTPVLDDIFDASEKDFRVDPKDPELIARSVLRIMANHDLSCERTLRMRSRLAKQFGWPAITEKYGALLKMIMAH